MSRPTRSAPGKTSLSSRRPSCFPAIRKRRTRHPPARKINARKRLPHARPRRRTPTRSQPGAIQPQCGASSAVYISNCSHALRTRQPPGQAPGPTTGTNLHHRRHRAPWDLGAVPVPRSTLSVQDNGCHLAVHPPPRSCGFKVTTRQGPSMPEPRCAPRACTLASLWRMLGESWFDWGRLIGHRSRDCSRSACRDGACSPPKSPFAWRKRCVAPSTSFSMGSRSSHTSCVCTIAQRVTPQIFGTAERPMLLRIASIPVRHRTSNLTHGLASTPAPTDGGLAARRDTTGRACVQPSASINVHSLVIVSQPSGAGMEESPRCRVVGLRLQRSAARRRVALTWARYSSA